MDVPATLAARRSRLRPMTLRTAPLRSPRSACAVGLGVALWGALLLGVGSAAAADGAPPEPSPTAAPAPKGFGESLTLRRCLIFTAKSLQDRQEDVEHQDWVVLALENRCPAPVLNLRVELLLVDTRGLAYGKTFWLLGQGERLDPGQRWEDTVPVPDPENRVARAWTIRVLRADTLKGRPRAAPPPPRDTR
jgi:hypothetical protein